MKEATKMEMHRSIIWHHSAVRWIPISDKWDIIAVYDSSDQLLFQGSTSEWFLQKQVR
jgi:hypothetical protein